MTITESLRCPTCHSGLTAVANGWRAFSLKPSFGNLREWLYTGWIYDSRRDVFEKGLCGYARLASIPTVIFRCKGASTKLAIG